MDGTIPVRKGDELHLQALEKFLREHIKELPDEPMQVSQFGSGLSNLTYLLSLGTWEVVLRRPPFGPVPPKAHDMKRECHILESLQPFFPLAPKSYLYSEDASVIGSPFFLMERKHGLVYDTSFPKQVSVSPKLCQQISESMVDTLIQLHNIPWEETELARISRPDGFMERQVLGWIARYERYKTEEINEAVRVQNWLIGHLPRPQAPTVIHYDYKLNNVMFSKENPSQIVGVFDWEMTTIGDPLADLGTALSYWMQQDDPDDMKHGLGDPPVTTLPGFFTREQFAARYAKKSGRELEELPFYQAFATFKLAVICQQIYYRWKLGQTQDERFSSLNDFVKTLIRRAHDYTEYGK